MLKYRNKKVEYDGMIFDSSKERDYWIVLQNRQKEGEITNLQRQVSYELIPRQTDDKGKFLYHPVKYVADMVYEENGELQVVDVKSKMTRKLQDYSIKKKLLYYTHHIKLQEVM